MPDLWLWGSDLLNVNMAGEPSSLLCHWLHLSKLLCDNRSNVGIICGLSGVWPFTVQLVTLPFSASKHRFHPVSSMAQVGVNLEKNVLPFLLESTPNTRLQTKSFAHVKWFKQVIYNCTKSSLITTFVRSFFTLIGYSLRILNPLLNIFRML